MEQERAGSGKEYFTNRPQYKEIDKWGDAERQQGRKKKNNNSNIASERLNTFVLSVMLAKCAACFLITATSMFSDHCDQDPSCS